MLLKKIKNILFGFTGTAIHCPYCKGMNVTFGTSKITKEDDGEWKESYSIKCKDCNAGGKITEIWTRKRT